jgi:hypothetical protein
MFKAEKATQRFLSKRLLVHCSPYGALVRQDLELLCNLYAESKQMPFNYAVLIHNVSTAYPDDIEAFLNGRRFVFVLRPHELIVENLD